MAYSISPQFQSYLGLQKILNSNHDLQENIIQNIDWLELDLNKEISKDELEIKFLDTFFSDTIKINSLRRIFNFASRNKIKIKVLILNPRSELAESRGKAINQSPIEEINKALFNIRNARISRKDKSKSLDENIEKKKFSEFINIEQQLKKIKESTDSLDIELKFYDVLTEAPLYIISNFVIKGLVLHGYTAADKPWMLFVNDKTQNNDIFDYMNNNFDKIWVNSGNSMDIRTSTLNKKNKPKCFIVHGHCENLVLELKNYLQSYLYYPEPIVLKDKPSIGKTIIEKFEDYASDIDIAFILLTPDDFIQNENKEDYYQPRPNVLFELGFFYGKMGRKSGRVILLSKQKFKLPSDLNGLIYIDVSNGIVAKGEELRNELKKWKE